MRHKKCGESININLPKKCPTAFASTIIHATCHSKVRRIFTLLISCIIIIIIKYFE